MGVMLFASCLAQTVCLTIVLVYLISSFSWYVVGKNSVYLISSFSLWPLLVPLALLFPIRPKHLWTASVCILYLLGLDSNSGEKRNGDSWCVYFWLMLGSIWSWRFMFISISKSAGAYRHSAPLYQRTMAWISDVHKLTGTDCAARSLFCGICCRLLLVLISYPATRLVSLSVPCPWPGSPHLASHCRGRGGREECIPRLKTAKREPGDRAMVILLPAASPTRCSQPWSALARAVRPGGAPALSVALLSDEVMKLTVARISWC